MRGSYLCLPRLMHWVHLLISMEWKRNFRHKPLIAEVCKMFVNQFLMNCLLIVVIMNTVDTCFSAMLTVLLISVKQKLAPLDRHVSMWILQFCIFCRNSTVKKVSGNRYSLQKFQSNSYKNIEKSNGTWWWRLCKIRGVDLFAKEAQFHDCCRKQYLVKRAPQPNTSAEIAAKKALISKAFSRVHDHIKTEVIQKGQVIKLAHLKILYNDTMTEFGEAAVAEITSHNLRQK